MTDKEKIFKWVNSVGTKLFDSEMVEYLVHKCNMVDIVNYYCNDIVSYAIENYTDKNKIKEAFVDLWSRSRNIDFDKFLSGFLSIDSRVINSIIDCGFDTLEKISKVNYRDIPEIYSIKESEVKKFIEEINYYSNEMNAVINTNRINIKRKK